MNKTALITGASRGIGAAIVTFAASLINLLSGKEGQVPG